MTNPTPNKAPQAPFSLAGRHWASGLIGRPWIEGGEGPEAFDCWGLVRWVFRERHGIDMPAMRMGQFTEGENVAAIKRAADAAGIHRCDDAPAPEDIVLLHDFVGRHVGVMIETSQGPRFLHACGFRTMNGPVGSVVCEAMRDVLRRYSEPEVWRRAA